MDDMGKGNEFNLPVPLVSPVFKLAGFVSRFRSSIFGPFGRVGSCEGQPLAMFN